MYSLLSVFSLIWISSNLYSLLSVFRLTWGICILLYLYYILFVSPLISMLSYLSSLSSVISPTGPCAAGYLCIIGSYQPSSSNTYDETNHRAYPCPAGHYCLEGKRHLMAAQLVEHQVGYLREVVVLSPTHTLVF